jgi:FKBP-type peptidyl-prolyl cis-trans isomerase FkpA
MRAAFLMLSLAVLSFGVAPAQGAPPQKPPAPTAGDDEQALYALGLSLWRGLAPLDLSAAEADVLRRGLEDAMAGKPRITPEQAAPLVAALRRARAPRALASQKVRSERYVAEAAQQPGAVKTPSGVLFFDLQPGTGEVPPATATVKVHYTGTLADGSEFDSSRKLGRPAELRLTDVIPCWRDGVQRMKVGGKARLVCPPDTAYGDRSRPAIPGGSALIFEIELIDAVATPSAAPPPVKSPASGPAALNRSSAAALEE